MTIFNKGIPSIPGVYEVLANAMDLNFDGGTGVYSFWNGEFWGATDTLHNAWFRRATPSTYQGYRWLPAVPRVVDAVPAITTL